METLCEVLAHIYFLKGLCVYASMRQRKQLFSCLRRGAGLTITHVICIDDARLFFFCNYRARQQIVLVVK